jgi:hypothetical protein
LSQPDGSVISLPGEGIASESTDGLTLGLKEWFDPSTGPSPLVLVLPQSVAELTWATADIIGGTLTTLAGGQRALVNPQAVYVYVNPDGSYAYPMPFKDLTGIGSRVQIAP